MTTVRGHNEGSMFVRRKGPQKGTWVSTVTMRNGRRASRVSHSREEAKAELAELLRLRDARAPVTGRIRLGAYLERWVSDDHGWAPKTWRRHEQIVRLHLIPALGVLRLADLSVRDIERYLAARPSGRTTVHVRATLRRALADALRDGIVARNAAALAQPPRVLGRERPVLDAAQARLLIESTRGTRYGPLWTILVTTGLRISEALGLAWSDVDLGGNDASPHGAPAVPVGRAGESDVAEQHARRVGAVQIPPRALRRDAERSGGPSIIVRHQLAREHGEWVRRPTKTAKGRRTIPLTALGVEALRAQREQQRADMGGSNERIAGGLESGVGHQVVAGHHPAIRRAGRSLVSDGGMGMQAPAHLPGDSAGVRPAEVDSGDRRPGTVIPIDGLVFTSPKGQPLHGENTVKALYAALDAAGLPRVTQHQLRHSCATLLFAQGVPLAVISRILGHSTIRITADIYTHSVEALNREAADKLQEALG